MEEYVARETNPTQELSYDENDEKGMAKQLQNKQNNFSFLSTISTKKYHILLSHSWNETWPDVPANASYFLSL